MKSTAAPPVSLPSQANRHWVITGGTNGIGLEAARAAADAGADITLTARTMARGAQVATELGERGATVSVIQLDLTDLDAVRRGAEQIVAADRPVDVLVNNAGAVSARRTETPSGAELILATNVLGPFAFTNHIAPLLTGRIVITG
ncbi:SDR family NAD(P)-dependent oxidoreductase [Demetria terragena]|uniref:SDR family NAD(P)-dependent oxidoreductase n=1 Tax=Demetria terragena TaxID=63959 RepID=UPI000360FF96|nr:SDR family NAD(P)-dependent oxidoreductase [Demetria terragena]